MELYLIGQIVNSNYDTYDFAVVAAENADAAKHIHPDGRAVWIKSDDNWTDAAWSLGAWAHPDDVTAQHIGTAVDGTKASTVIVASFVAS